MKAVAHQLSINTRLDKCPHLIAKKSSQPGSLSPLYLSWRVGDDISPTAKVNELGGQNFEAVLAGRYEDFGCLIETEESAVR